MVSSFVLVVGMQRGRCCLCEGFCDQAAPQSAIQSPLSATPLHRISQFLHLFVMMPAVFCNDPEGAVPFVRADRKGVTSERKLSANVGGRPKEPSLLGEGDTWQALDDTAQSIEPDGGHLEADALIVFLCLHGREAER
jgi:hypothetical protein